MKTLVHLHKGSLSPDDPYVFCGRSYLQYESIYETHGRYQWYKADYMAEPEDWENYTVCSQCVRVAKPRFTLEIHNRVGRTCK